MPAGNWSRSGPDGPPGCSLSELRTRCPAAFAFALDRIETPDQLQAFAWALGRMTGIGEDLLHAAAARHGLPALAVAVLAIVQRGAAIRNPAGYFRTVMLGERAEGFRAEALLRALCPLPAAA